MSVANIDNLASVDLAAYVRQRSDPTPGDEFYLHLSDLSVALRSHASTDPVRILDFGCGGSPYRSLFPNATYQCADLKALSPADFEIDEDSRVNAPSAVFDLVLSTQVLEHCANPSNYLFEARRVLRPGGKILLTTHGTWEDHGCPFDFIRWTADGLERELMHAGFEVQACQKLTTSGRAIAFLLERHGRWFRESRYSLFGLPIWTVQRLLYFRPSWFHSWCDSNFAQNRVVDGHEFGHSIYLALLVAGVRKD